MEENNSAIDFEEVLDTEIEDIWNIIFPYMTERKAKTQKIDSEKQTKPRRYLNFLTMLF